MPSQKPSRRRRGIYVERTICGAVKITAIANSGDELVVMTVHPKIYDPRIRRGVEKILNDADPAIHLVSSGD